MPKQQPVDDRDVLKLKLQVLHDYITHHERKLDQFHIDIRKATPFRHHQDLGDLVDRATSILSDLYTADPPKSLIEDELNDARMAMIVELSGTQELAEPLAQEIKAALVEGVIDGDFDRLLARMTTHVFEGLNALCAPSGTTAGTDDQTIKLLKLMESAGPIFDHALTPARRLRARWVEQLNGRERRSLSEANRPRRRARPKNESTAGRNKQMQEAWLTGRYRKYAELGSEFHITAEVVRRAVSPIRRKPK